MLQRLIKMQNNHSRPTFLSGFTIVELLIVIVVIGILASITVVAFRGVQQRATSSSYVSSMDHWEKVIRAEFAVSGRLPLTSNFTCLGSAASNFPSNSDFAAGSCGQLIDKNASVFNFMFDQTFNDQFQLTNNFKNGLLPQMKRQQLPDNGSVIMRGVIANIESATPGQFHVDLIWYPESKNTCGRGTDLWATDATLAGGGCLLAFDLR